ncbi:hypothetical protein P5673_008033 [Acropora cervicornis]|uniref:Uncharacterized protein n=1 Tax=Acropora cervicornis TaxID=6130 RepID=A0AAD9VBR1_ACRCE|nr:hypothetical protein P5673_008033 [Acropora cervicornis]
MDRKDVFCVFLPLASILLCQSVKSEPLLLSQSSSCTYDYQVSVHTARGAHSTASDGYQIHALVSWSISVLSPPAKLISYLRGNQTVKREDSYLGMLNNDLYSDYNYYGSQVYVPGRKKLEYKQ